MPNDDLTPLPRLLIAVTGLRAPAGTNASFEHLARALADDLPARALPLALLRLRLHLARSGRGRADLSGRARAPRRPAGAERGR